MKKKNYLTMAEAMQLRGRKFAKGTTYADQLSKTLEFARAYAKLCRTAEAAKGWIDALTAQCADDAVIAVFQAKLDEFTVVEVPVTPELLQA